MIVNIVGTNSAGKSHVVRSLLQMAITKKPEFVAGRQLPIGYLVEIPRLTPVFVVGAYEDGVAGCDSIASTDLAYNTIIQSAKKYGTVLFEGVITLNLIRGPALVKAFPDDIVAVLMLTTLVDECIRGAGRDKAKEVEQNASRANQYMNKMRGAGASIYRVGRDDALIKLLTILR